MTLDLNTIHLYRCYYLSGSQCTGNDQFYAKTDGQARRIAKSRCSRYEKVSGLEKVTQKKINENY